MEAGPRRDAAARDTGALRLADVPFVAQSPSLCGGAAAAMVLRYWGERGVHAGDFARLVSGRPAGITTTDLLSEVRRRGWRARRISAGDLDTLAKHLEAGRPVIALLRVAPERYHYVVLLALTGERAVVHDPARGPYRVMSRDEWAEAWRATGRWAALVFGEGDGDRRDGRGATRENLVSPRNRDLPRACAELIRNGVEHARGGRSGEAEAALRAAAELCPGRSAPWAELAGLRFRDGAYGEAARVAERAVDRDDGSGYSWRILASSRYLSGDRRGALRAWNRIGAPSVDHVRIQGLRRTRHRPALDLLRLSPGTTLTPGRLLRGRRRLGELPAVRRARVDYRAVEGERAEVRVAAWERSPPTASATRVAQVAIRGLARRTVRLALPSPTGGGELVAASWRWTPGRPRLSLEARAPAPPGAGAVWGVDGSWERQTYASPSAPDGDDSGPEFVEERRRVRLSVSEWLTGRLRGGASVGLDRWEGGPNGPGDPLYLRTGIEATWRPAGDGWSVRARGTSWSPLSGDEPSFRRLGIGARARVGEPGRGVTGEFLSGFRRVTGGAPLGLWPGAGTGRGRSPLLRAHPLLEDGRIVGPAFGRSLVHARADATAWVVGVGPLRAGVAGFVDGAVAGGRPEGWPGSPALADAGTGLRLRAGDEGTLRLDVAVGLRDGRTALSAGWLAPVP